MKPDWLSKADYDAAPENLSVRELRVSNGKGGKGKILVTTLCCPKRYKKADLKILYQQRWHVELNVRHIKTTLEMDVLSCHTPEMIAKEIWIYLLAYILIKTLIAQSAAHAARLPNELSFKHTLQLWLAWGRRAQEDSHDSLIAILKAIAKSV